MGWDSKKVDKDKKAAEDQGYRAASGSNTPPDLDEQRKDMQITNHIHELSEKEQFEKEAAEEALATEGHGASPVALERLNKEIEEGTPSIAVGDHETNEVKEDMSGETREMGELALLIRDMENLCATGADVRGKAGRVHDKILGKRPEELNKVTDGGPSPSDPPFKMRMQELINTLTGHFAGINHDLEALDDSL